MALTAADIAQTKVASLSPDAPLVNAHRFFVDEQVSGAPVVNDLGRVVGVISAADLVRAVVDLNDTGRELPLYPEGEFDFRVADFDELPEDFQTRLREVVVGDVMTDSPITIDAKASIREVAERMRDTRVHRVIVVNGDSLLGIISSMDLVSLLADGRGND